MTDTALRTIMNEKYPVKTLLSHTDVFDFTMEVAEIKGYLLALKNFNIFSERQYKEWIDLMSKTVLLWGAKHV